MSYGGAVGAAPSEESRAGWSAPTRRLSPFVTLCGVGFLGRLSYEMVRSPTTSLYAKHLGAPVELIGLIVSAVTITGIFGKLPSGALSDLFGFRRLMMAGAWVKATAPFVYLVAFTWPVLLAVRFYHGLATALYAPPASALVAKVYPGERGRRLGLYNSAENAGVVLGPVLGGAVLGLTMTNFHIAFIVAGGIGTLSLLAMLRIPRDSVTSAPQPGSEGPRRLGPALRDLRSGVKEIASDPGIRLVSLVEAVLWMGIGSVQAYLPLYALTIHLSIFKIGLIVGGQGIASVLIRPIMGRRSDRVKSRTPLIVLGSLLCIGTLIAIPYATSFIVLFALAAVFGLGTGIVTPSTMAAIGDLVTKGNYGSAMGVFGSLWDTGHATGPLVFGFLLAALGYRTSWLIMALIMGAAVTVFLLRAANRILAPAGPEPGT